MDPALYYNAVAVAFMGDYRKITKLYGHHGNWEKAYGSLRGLGLGSCPDAVVEWKKLEKADVRLVLAEDPDYPTLLKETPRPPLGIYIKGMMSDGVLKNTVPTLAIVGTRRATPGGKDAARRFARELARSGFTIMSGLALGIDAAAHEGCLEGRGTTLAILAGGLHDVYPHENKKLAENILAQGGAIVSEYPLGAPPYPDRFLERNRVISGLARGALIVEAPVDSGSLATARYAMEQNRDVFVVPGPVTHGNFSGSHQLIRQGAELVTAPTEILASYGIASQENIARLFATATPHEKQVLEALQKISAPADVDKITAMTKLEPRSVNRTIGFLLMDNRIKEVAGGYTI